MLNNNTNNDDNKVSLAYIYTSAQYLYVFINIICGEDDSHDIPKKNVCFEYEWFERKEKVYPIYY